MWHNMRPRILRKNYLLKHCIEGKIEGTGRRGRRRKQLKETRTYGDLKEEELDRAVWRKRFGRDHGPVVKAGYVMNAMTYKCKPTR